MAQDVGGKFESGVNPEGIQTKLICTDTQVSFESGVNPEGIQTGNLRKHMM